MTAITNPKYRIIIAVDPAIKTIHSGLVNKIILSAEPVWKYNDNLVQEGQERKHKPVQCTSAMPVSAGLADLATFEPLKY